MVEIGLQHCPSALTKGVVHRAEVKKRPASRLVEPEAGVAENIWQLSVPPYQAVAKDRARQGFYAELASRERGEGRLGERVLNGLW